MYAQFDHAGIFADNLRASWDDFKDISLGPVEQFAWCQACVDGLPGIGEIRPFFVSKQGRLLAIAPLVLRPGLAPRFELIGVRQLHEPMDFVYTGSQPLATLCDQLAGQRIPINLQRVPRHSPLLAELRRAFNGRGWLHVSATTPYPFLDLDETWRSPENHFNAGRRSDFRRARRHAEQAGVLRFELLQPKQETLDHFLAEAYDAELHGWKGSQGTALAIDPLRADFYRRYFHACAQQGILRMAFMRLDGKAIAMQISVFLNNRLWLLKIGYNEAYARMSPGTLLMLEVVRQAARDGTQSIEFLGSVEPWTELWTKEVRECEHIRVYPRGWPGAAAFLVDAANWLARQLQRPWQHVHS